MLEVERKGDWLQTYMGNAFWPLDPRPEDVDIFDITWALSHLCRYAGHTSEFYSVAEHSYYVSLYVPREHALWGLLHDASEAYLADIPKPLKPYLTGYKEIEHRVMEAICRKFGLPLAEPLEVKEIDTRILGNEQKSFMPDPPREWGLSLPELDIPRLEDARDPYIARRVFYRRFITLTEGRVEFTHDEEIKLSGTWRDLSRWRK